MSEAYSVLIGQRAQVKKGKSHFTKESSPLDPPPSSPAPRHPMSHWCRTFQSPRCPWEGEDSGGTGRVCVGHHAVTAWTAPTPRATLGGLRAVWSPSFFNPVWFSS